MQVNLDDLLVVGYPANSPAATQARISSLEGTLAAATNVAIATITGTVRINSPKSGGSSGAGADLGDLDLSEDDPEGAWPEV